MYWKKSLCCYCDTDTEAWYSSSRSSIVISADGHALQKVDMRSLAEDLSVQQCICAQNKQICRQISLRKEVIDLL